MRNGRAVPGVHWLNASASIRRGSHRISRVRTNTVLSSRIRRKSTFRRADESPTPSYSSQTQSYSATPGPTRLTASPLELITTMPQPPSTDFADSFFGHLATWKGITPATANSTTSPSANPSLVLSVPIDCDAELWQSFVGSSLWDSREVTTGEDAGLLEYFVSFASVTVVARSEGGTCTP